jgi:hypothetical protein
MKGFIPIILALAITFGLYKATPVRQHINNSTVVATEVAQADETQVQQNLVGPPITTVDPVQEIKTDVSPVVAQEIVAYPAPSYQDTSTQAIKNYICSKSWDCATALAVAKCESGFNPVAKGDNYVIGGLYAPSIGIFQIRLLAGRPSENELYDPYVNIDYAHSMWQGQGWRPWSCYRLI